MAKLKITKLQSDKLINNFNCGNTSINTLVHKSYYPTILQHGYAFEISLNGEIKGYYMISFLNIKLDFCPDEIADYSSDVFTECVAIRINFIAIDKKYQNMGIGSNIMKYIITSVIQFVNSWPIRLITLDALKDKTSWYKSMGFKPLGNIDDNSTTIPMYYDCILDRNAIITYCKKEV